MKSVMTSLAAVGALVIGLSVNVPDVARAQNKGNEKGKKGEKKEAPTPIGAWFGIARPCPPPPGDTSASHAAFCTLVCGACPNVPGTLPPEVPMMPTLLADGTVLADDAGELQVYHTTAHGKWAESKDDGLPNLFGRQRFKAHFLWLGQNAFGSNKLDNAVKPRFVTYFDPEDPDRMIGYIQPHFYSPGPTPFSTNGIVNVRPANPADVFSGDHIPAVDPLAPLPTGCNTPATGGNCLGTYHFVIRRIKVD